jgi:hypothetical protein
MKRTTGVLFRLMPRLERWKSLVAPCPGALLQAFAFRAFGALVQDSLFRFGIGRYDSQLHGGDLLATSDNTRVLAPILSYAARFSRRLNRSIRGRFSFSRESFSEAGAQACQLAPARGVPQIVQ